MNAYELLVALVLATAIVMRGYREHNKKYVVVACLLLFAIYGLRDTYHIGVDTRTSYLGSFWRAQKQTWSEVIQAAKGKNVGFALFNKCFVEFISRDDYQLYISLIAAFVTICFGRMVYRYSPNPLQSILYHFGLLFFTFHFSALKQSIAMAILMLAFDQLVARRPIRFVLIVLLAGQFHFPALVFLPAYWITKINPGRAYLFLLAVLLILTYSFRNQIINFMIELYREEESEVNLADVQFLRTKAIVMLVIVAVAVCFRAPTREDYIYSILLEFMGLAIVFQTFCGYNNIFERLADYYFQFSVIFIPMVFDRYASRKTQLNARLLEVAYTLAPYVFCGYSVYRFLKVVNNDRFLSPFRFFFQR